MLVKSWCFSYFANLIRLLCSATSSTLSRKLRRIFLNKLLEFIFWLLNVIMVSEWVSLPVHILLYTLISIRYLISLARPLCPVGEMGGFGGAPYLAKIFILSKIDVVLNNPQSSNWFYSKLSSWYFLIRFSLSEQQESEDELFSNTPSLGAPFLWWVAASDSLQLD